MSQGLDYPFATVEVVCKNQGGGYHVKVTYHDGHGAPIARYVPFRPGTYPLYFHQKILEITIEEQEGQLTATALKDVLSGSDVKVK